MAGGIAALVNAQQQAVVFAVDVQGDDLLHMAGGFAFLPELLARTAPEVDQARLQGALKRFLVHKRQHQDIVGGIFLHDHGNQPIAVKM
ncbi:MAG TPA: hypothetical protein VF099_07155 [Ktedonobacterales bacterium]